uniref:CD83 molecule n=1 Tax=Sphenodon punctatus TaxID=8508 RepID=A0A8D0H148_SPHPU
MPSMHFSPLVILMNAWCLIHGAAESIPEVVVTCREDALLPCNAPQDPQVTYTAISWYKVDGDVAEWSEMVWKDLEYDETYRSSKDLNGSLEVSNSTPYSSLRIKNTTSHSTGTYMCTLWAPDGKQNQSGTVTLKVTGCPKLLDEKIQKYRSEIVLLSFLGVFYLLLIFFTCVSIFPNVCTTHILIGI